MSLLQRTRRVYFVGIGGIGMSGIAEILIRSGHQVFGSDLGAGDMVEHLKKLGAKIQKGHSEQLISQALPDVLVYSTAIPMNNPELVFARSREIPIVRRAEMLGELMRLRRGIAVAGSHGKTTTTGILSLLLKEADLDPAVVIGGRFDAIGSNAAWGAGQWLVAEADESDGSFLRLSPELAVVTNIDREHMDHYGDFEKSLQAFEEFLDRLPFYGRAVLCSDCPNLRSLRKKLNKPKFWYGMDQSQEPDFWVEVQDLSSQPAFSLHRKVNGKYQKILSAKIGVPGRHNLSNAAAAAIVALELEISPESISSALMKFTGVRRRFEKRGTVLGKTLIEDYAHHPTEIRATVAAARTVYKDAPLVVFQPHRFTRTRDCWEDFASAFQGVDTVVCLPIYAASEARESWVDAYDKEAFAKNLKGTRALYAENFASALEQISQWLKSHPHQDAPIMVMGAGDVSKLIPEILNLR